VRDRSALTYVVPLELPLVVSLEQERTDKPPDGRRVGEDSDDIGTAFDLGVEPVQRIGRCVRCQVAPRTFAAVRL